MIQPHHLSPPIVDINSMIKLVTLLRNCVCICSGGRKMMISLGVCVCGRLCFSCKDVSFIHSFILKRRKEWRRLIQSISCPACCSRYLDGSGCCFSYLLCMWKKKKKTTKMPNAITSFIFHHHHHEDGISLYYVCVCVWTTRTSSIHSVPSHLSSFIFFIIIMRMCVV